MGKITKHIFFFNFRSSLNVLIHVGNDTRVKLMCMKRDGQGWGGSNTKSTLTLSPMTGTIFIHIPVTSPAKPLPIPA